ncbi:MAG: HPP family protein, partial [Haloquadratum sp.]
MGGLVDAALDRVAAVRNRIRRIQRREVSEFRRWVQNTENLLHLSIVLFVPVVIGLVTYLSNHVQTLSFLLFPPLASGTFTLFSDPESEYANPTRFVASLSAGAICGLVAYTIARLAYGAVGAGIVHPESAALAIFLTGLVTWAGRIEAPSAFSTALLALVTGEVDPVTYVVSVFLASSVVAAAFVLWREQFYAKRATYLYETVQGDDHVLVPMRGETAEKTAIFGAQLAAAHEAGKVVLFDVVAGVEETNNPDAVFQEELDAEGETGAADLDEADETGEDGAGAAEVETDADTEDEADADAE